MSKSNFNKTKEKKEKFLKYKMLDIAFPDFILEDEDFMLKKGKELLEKSKKEQDLEVKKKILSKALYFNNVDQEIILENLKYKGRNEKDMFLKKYGYYLSDSNYKKIFNKDKKNIIHLIKKLFSLLEEYKWELTYIETILDFVEEYAHTEIRNVFSEDKIEDEIALYFFELTKYIQTIIFSKKEFAYSNETFDQKLNKYFKKDDQIELRKMIENSIKDNNIKPSEYDTVKNNVIFLNFECFSTSFQNISYLIKYLKNEILICLQDINNVDNSYIFIYIKEMIINLLKGNSNSKNKNIINKIKKYYAKNNKDEEKVYINNIINEVNKLESKIEIEIENENTLIIKKIIKDIFEKRQSIRNLKLNDIYIYDWETLKDDLTFFNELNFDVPIKYQFLDYIKIQYLNKNNFLRYSMDFIENILNKILISETILSLLNEIFPGYQKYRIFQKDSVFLKKLAKKALKRMSFIYFELKREGCTYPPFKRILYYTYNRYKNKLDCENDYKIFLVVNIGCFIYIFYKEFLGHFLLHYLDILTKIEYNSPFSTIDNKLESGRFIEDKLFGKSIKIFSFCRLLYILDINNYNRNFNTFRSNFEKLKENSIINLSKAFLNLVNNYFHIRIKSDDTKIEIKINLYDNNEDFEIAIENATFEDCLI